MNKRASIIGLCIALLLGINLSAQEKENYPRFNDSKHQLSVLYGYGGQDLLDVRYQYEVQFFKLQYSFTVLNKEKWAMDAVAIPQYNIVRLRPRTRFPDETNGIEYGINFGVLLRKKLKSDVFSPYILASAGPHYISDAPTRQATGFIFSDNFFIGTNIKLHNRLYFDVRIGIRHISNFNIKLRNLGINNTIANVGLTVPLGR